MNTNRIKTLILAVCLTVLLCGMGPRTAVTAPAADSASGTEQVHPLQLAQEYTSSKWPGSFAGPSGEQDVTGPGSPSTMGQGMGPGSQGMMPRGMGRGGQGMMGPGMGPPGQGMMGPGMGRPGQVTMPPGMGPGGQGVVGTGNQGMPGRGGQGMMGPGNQGMMPGPMGGSPMGMFNAIGTLNLTSEQRGKYDAINQELNKRMQEITDRMNSEAEKLRKLQEEQMRIGRTLYDLRGHMLQATMDAANRAEELLTDEQRQTMINQGRHIMMQPGSLAYPGAQGGTTEQP
jgi:hypothetical protein